MSRTALHIGIVACSAEGAALCYRTICIEGPSLLGPHNHPEVSMHTLPFVDHVNCMRAGDWQGVADQLIASSRKLAAIGADFVICPDNTAHRAMPLVHSRSPLPWLHIAEEVARESARRGYQVLVARVDDSTAIDIEGKRSSRYHKEWQVVSRLLARSSLSPRIRVIDLP